MGDSTKPRVPLDGRRPRDREVLEKAIKLFHEKGYASTSMQDVADELGMLKGSLYYYVDTKETLLRKIFEDSHEEVREIAERYRHGNEPAIDRIAAFLRDSAMWYLTNLQRASLFAREWRHATGDLREEMTKQRKYYDQVLRDLIQAAVEEGSASADLDVRLAAYFVMSALSSLPDWFKPRGRDKAETVASSYAAMALQMIAPKG
ncbi:TetR/AcrR family transcriptional regulator [Microbispora sp. H10836]|uniref:TetR/AcrR family transcriptional regulator n=1 Tax=Microbispora sp. H10836 TaxID=2729106 RepID=UPI0014728B05|nr:TetR/AcrR family transcriptional regulator [Microbispora sp. H10836]